MTTLTRSELATSVLRRMALVTGEDAPNAADLSRMLDYVDQAIAVGRHKRCVFWEPDETPKYAEQALGSVVAAFAATEFSKPKFINLEEQGWRDLFALTCQPYRGAKKTKASHF